MSKFARKRTSDIFPNYYRNYMLGMEYIEAEKPCQVGDLIRLKGQSINAFKVKFVYLHTFMVLSNYGKLHAHLWSELGEVIKRKGHQQVLRKRKPYYIRDWKMELIRKLLKGD